jgi:hypothetical protein
MTSPWAFSSCPMEVVEIFPSNQWILHPSWTNENWKWLAFITTIGGYFANHISSQTTKKEVSESPPLRTIIPRKILSLCDTKTFTLVQSQVLHNYQT